MTSFKSYLSSLIYGCLLTSSVLMTSCDTAHDLDPLEESESNTTFVVPSVSGSLQVQELDEDKIPESYLLNMKACLKDNLHNRNVNNQEFRIKNEVEVVAETMSDENGCIYWAEHLVVDYFNDSNYLKLTRQVESMGIHKGTRSIELAVNPWGHGESLPQVVDLRRGEVVSLMTNKDSVNTLYHQNTIKKPIYLKDLNLKFTETSLGNGIVYDVEMSTGPSVILKNTKGQNIEVSVIGGDYLVSFALVHELVASGDTRRIILAQTPKVEATNIRGSLQASFPMELTSFPTDGLYRAYVTIEPKNSDSKLKSGQAMFDLGKTGALAGSMSGKLLNEVVKAEGHYQVDPQTLIKLNKAEGDTVGYRKAGVFVKENLKLAFKSFGNETTTERDVEFQVTACLDRNDGRSIGLRNITVLKIKKDEDGNRVEAQRPLQSNQCVTWEDSIRHKYFLPERKVFTSFILKNEDLGLKEEVPVMINPWDFGWTFGRDARLIEAEAIQEEQTEERPVSTLFMRSWTFKEQGVSYDIDKNLRLHQKLHLRISLDPKAERPSSQTNGLNQVEDLRKGEYLLRVLVRRNDIEDEKTAGQYVTHGETIATVTKGNMVADIDFDITDYEVMRSRNRVLFEIATIHEACIETKNNISFTPKSVLDLEDEEDMECYKKIGETKTKGLTHNDIIDYESGLAPALFEGPIVLAGTSWSDKVDPYVIEDMDKARERFHDRYEALMKSNRSTFAFPREYKNLSTLINVGVEQKKLEKYYYNTLSSAYANDNLLFEAIDTLGKEELAAEINKIDAEMRWFGDHKYSEESLNQLVENPFSSDKMIVSLCRYFADYMRKGNVEGIDYFKKLKNYEMAFFEECVLNSAPALGERTFLSLNDRFSPGFLRNYINGLKTKPPFTFVRQYIGDDIKYIGHEMGIPYGYSIRTGYSLSQSFGFGTSASLGIGGKVNLPGGIFGLSGSASASTSWRWSRGTNVGTGFGLGLDIEENIEKFNIVNPKKCLTIRLAPWLIEKVFGSGINKLYRNGDENAEKYEGEVRSFGLFICNDMKEEKVTKTENYYYLEQDSGGGILQDPTDIRNRSVRILIRGKNEFYSFVERFEGDLEGPTGTYSEGDVFGSTYNYLKEYTLGTPGNYPGIYTDIDETSALYSSFYE